MGSRKLTSLEQKIHQATLAAPSKTLSAEELSNIFTDATARTQALNGLLGAGLFKVLKDSKGRASFRAVVKKEHDVKKDMGDEEALVLDLISASGDEGIWTKHLKARTNLHQTNIDRHLKALVQKSLIKSIKSVKHPTRKIYMLAHLEPSVEVTGGPWYTDNELDTEFIKLLSSACLRFIRDKTWPRVKSSSGSVFDRPLYAIAASPTYPSAKDVLTFLKKSKITETELSVEHVEQLLNVLRLDGDVEKLPAYGPALWDANPGLADEGTEDEDEDRSSRKKKKKKKKRSRSSDDDDGDDGLRRKRSRHAGDASGTDQDSDMGSEDERPKSKARKKRRSERSSSPQTSSDSGSDSDSDTAPKRSASRSKSSSKRKSSDHGRAFESDEASDIWVYRAVRQERLSLFASGLTEVPCGRCPVLEFCKDGGPVSPSGCVYYEDWISRPVAGAE